MLLKPDFQTYDQHATWGVEGVFAGGAVDATIHSIEEVVYSDGRFYECPLRDIECVGSIEVPDTITRCIFVGRIISFALQTSVQVHIQLIISSCVVIVGCYRGCMTDATL